MRPPLCCHGHSRPIVELNYSPDTPDGSFLVSASKDGMPMIRRGDTGDWVGTFEGHKGCVWSCVLNKSAEVAATGSADFHASMYSAITGDCTHRWEHKHIVRCVHFADDNHHLVTGCQDKGVRIFDINQPDAEPVSFLGCADSVRTVRWLHDDRHVLVSYLSTPGMALYDLRAGAVAMSMDSSKPVTSVDVTFDGQLLTTADANHVTVYDAATMRVRTQVVTDFEVESASLSLEQGMIVAGGSDMWAHVYDAQTGGLLKVYKGHHGPVHTIRFAPGGESFASGSEDGTIRIWFTKDRDENN